MKDAIKRISTPLNTSKDLDPLVDKIGDAKIVMLGEASHGTHEYYSWRTAISKRLIQEKDFDFIAVEGDWPDMFKINSFIKSKSKDPEDVIGVLDQFKRWPTWMWANWEVAALMDWLKNYNSSVTPGNKVGFYGLDVYSLWESMDAVMDYLKKEDPDSMELAKNAFKCFEPFNEDEGIAYARATRFVPVTCEQEVIDLLVNIRNTFPTLANDDESALSARQNALVAVNAERYFRIMIRSGAESWNVRDRHMEETLSALLDFHGPGSKAIVWEHNTHIGDARATNMAKRGMVNLGQLVRVKYNPENVVLVGFGSYEGSVIAGKEWGAPMQIMQVPEAQKGSWEYYLHQLENKNKLLIFNNENEFKKPIEHRAIGVVYNPEQEKYGNYVPSIINQRYDAFIYIDYSQALHPLHVQADKKKMPESFPFNF